MQPVTGVSTPNSAASLRPLNLAHGSIEHVLLVPNSLYLNCSQLRDQFYTTLPTASEDNGGDDEPASPTELLAAFLGYAAKTVVDEPGPYDEVLSLLLTEFETRYLRGNILSMPSPLLSKFLSIQILPLPKSPRSSSLTMPQELLLTAQ